MSYKILPLEMIQSPNYWSPSEGGVFKIIQPNATTLWFQLQIHDSLGERRFIPATGASVSLDFMRANQFVGSNRAPTETVQTVTKTATQSVDDKSLFSVSLTTQDVQNIKSGTVKVNLTQSGVTTTWLQNYTLVKKLTDPGC